MPRANNAVAGYYTPPDGVCRHRCTVHVYAKGKRKGELYLRCHEGHGADQRTGVDLQRQWYEGAEWVGEAPPAPPCLGGGGNWTPAADKPAPKAPELTVHEGGKADDGAGFPWLIAVPAAAVIGSIAWLMRGGA